MEKKRGFLTKIDDAFQAFKSGFLFGSDFIPPYYSQLNDGTDSYNYELERHGPFSFIGFGESYFKPTENLKWYYENVPFLADCVDIYVDIASQVQIQEVNEDGEPVENSEILEILEQPNAWQDNIAFTREYVINILTTGINVMQGNFFKNGNFRINPRLYNIDFYNLEMPKIKNPYEMKPTEIEELIFKEQLEGGQVRNLKHYELAFTYDRVAKNTYGERGFNSRLFLNPVSRIFSLRKDLQIMMNTADTMAYISGKNVNWIVSKKAAAGQLAPLGNAEKMDIERKLSGNGMYGARLGKSDVVATNEDLLLLNMTRDNRKMQMIEIQNNAKENIRSRYGIPRDLLDAYTGTNSGSTYENQQFAESRFTLNNVKSITDSLLYAIEKKNKSYFDNRRTKLIGKYDHMPSVVAINTKLKNEGFKLKTEAFIKLLEAYEKAKGLTESLTWDQFINDNGFDEFINTQKAE